MKHIDEFTLELYVLDSDKVARQRDEIGEHLRDCEGCRAIFGEMSSFYRDLDTELAKTPVPVAGEPARALEKRRQDLSVWEEKLTLRGRAFEPGPVGRFTDLVRRNPVLAAGATFAFTALLAVAVVMGSRSLGRDTEPAYTVLNDRTGRLEVRNSENGLLWERPLRDIHTYIERERNFGLPSAVVMDFEGDGHREVLTTLHLGGMPQIPTRNLHIFDGEGNFRDIAFERRVSYRGTDYEKPVMIAGSLFRVVATPSGGREILSIVTNDRSPSAIVRMNNGGEVIGEYWHFGQPLSLYLHDVTADGTDDLIVCGINDVNDQSGPSDPFIAVLDPSRITGSGESSVTRGFGHPVSGAEIHYLKLPLTEANRVTRKGAGITRMVRQDDRLIFSWETLDELGKAVHLEFVFSERLDPLRVLSTTQCTEFFNRLQARGEIDVRLDGGYLDSLRSRIAFWDGREWKGGKVKVSVAEGTPGPS